MTDRIASNTDGTIAMLLDTVEKIRAQKYPELPEDLIRGILLMHEDLTRPEIELIRAIDGFVERLMAEEE